MDWLLWSYGEKVAQQRQHGKPWELDFLRGMHQGPALTNLAMALGAVCGKTIRVTSIWLDKHAWISWLDAAGRTSGRRELADLAVIIRRPHNGRIYRWMWLLQAKRTDDALAPYHGPSAMWELDLLHRMPLFTLKGCNQAFDLQSDFHAGNPCDPLWGVHTPVPWTFLDIDGDPTSPKSVPRRFSKSPINVRWVGESLASTNCWASKLGFHEPQLASYFESLVTLLGGATAGRFPAIQRMQSNFLPGGPVASTHREWSRLYSALMHGALAPTTGHARSAGNPTGAVVQNSLRSLMRIAYMVSLIAPDERRQLWHRSSELINLTGVAGPFDTWVALSSPLDEVGRKAWGQFDEQCYGEEIDGASIYDEGSNGEGVANGGGEGGNDDSENEFDGPRGMGVMIIDAVDEPPRG